MSLNVVKCKIAFHIEVNLFNVMENRAAECRHTHTHTHTHTHKHTLTHKHKSVTHDNKFSAKLSTIGQIQSL